jgi:hypothetical protein
LNWNLNFDQTKGLNYKFGGWGLSELFFQIPGVSLENSGLLVDFGKAEGPFCNVARNFGF